MAQKGLTRLKIAFLVKFWWGKFSPFFFFIFCHTVFPLSEEDGATTDVGNEDSDAQRYRDRHPAERLHPLLGELLLLLLLHVLLLICTNRTSQTIVRQAARPQRDILDIKVIRHVAGWWPLYLGVFRLLELHQTGMDLGGNILYSVFPVKKKVLKRF